MKINFTFIIFIFALMLPIELSAKKKLFSIRNLESNNKLGSVIEIDQLENITFTKKRLISKIEDRIAENMSIHLPLIEREITIFKDKIILINQFPNKKNPSIESINKKIKDLTIKREFFSNINKKLKQDIVFISNLEFTLVNHKKINLIINSDELKDSKLNLELICFPELGDKYIIESNRIFSRKRYKNIIIKNKMKSFIENTDIMKSFIENTDISNTVCNYLTSKK